MVEFPHWPLDEMMVPIGRGADEVDEVDEIGVDEDELGVGVGVTIGASPQRPYCGWQPTSSPQNSNSAPHQP